MSKLQNYLKIAMVTVRFFIRAYMKKFLSLPKIKNDDGIKGLRNLYDQIESSVRNSQTLKVDTNS